MSKGITMIRRGVLYFISLVLVAGYPVAAMAETQESATESTPPAATQETEKPELTYTFNPATGTWDSEEWQFNAKSGQYEVPPKPVIIEPKSTDTTKTDKDINTSVTVDTKVDSTVKSGDASVKSNSKGGNATSGDATAVANIMNVVNSSIATGENQKIATFTQDIMGDVKGDIVLYPMILKAMLEANANKQTDATKTDTSINATTNFDVNNDVDVSASSGNATVSENTEAGNATTGSAHAVANVVNILNSMIAAQDSFIGTINIYGNLEGDILIAPDFIPQMLASNGAKTTSGDTKVKTQDSTTIVNNITTVANSGAADVIKNTEAGSATSGAADTNVVIFNVTGHEVVAANSLLVFVNVLGKWVGMIVDAPQGATAAMLGSGVESHTQYTPDLTVNAQTEHGITNTIAVTAESGDALVSSNTKGGNATSGNATAQANVANVSGSQFNMTGFMGILFINVFQNWFGDFGYDTEYGNPVNEPTPEEPSGPIQFVPAIEQPAQTAQPAVQYTLIDSRTVADTGEAEIAAIDQTIPQEAGDSSEVLGAATKSKEEEVQSPSDYRILIVAGSLFVIGASALGIRRILQ